MRGFVGHPSWNSTRNQAVAIIDGAPSDCQGDGEAPDFLPYTQKSRSPYTRNLRQPKHVYGSSRGIRLGAKDKSRSSIYKDPFAQAAGVANTSSKEARDAPMLLGRLMALGLLAEVVWSKYSNALQASKFRVLSPPPPRPFETESRQGECIDVPDQRAQR